MQNITAGFRFRNLGEHATLGDMSGAFYYKNAGPDAQGAMAGQIVNTSFVGFDASRVARTSTETRGPNTAFSPRIICV